MPWLELAVKSVHPEFVEELLTAVGAQAISQMDGADTPVLEPLPGETPLWPKTVTVGLFDMNADLAAAREFLLESLPHDAELEFSDRRLEDTDWAGTWLSHARPLRFRDRLWICPSGHHVDAAGAVIVHLDPGLAFGTGNHPSTALCLDWLAEAAISGRRVLDYGCGSGVLAIAALRLGANHAEAVDIDEQARQATAENARRNLVYQHLKVTSPHSLVRRRPQFDCVLANILAGVLIELAPQLAQHTAAGGFVVLAGLLERQAAEVQQAYEPWFTFVEVAGRDGWSRLVGRRHGSPQRDAD